MVGSPEAVAAALRQVSRGLEALASALLDERDELTQEERTRLVIGEWGRRGLSRAEAVALFRKHGLAPQAVGGWVRGDWLRTGDDGLRYLTERSLEWVDE